ncbi:uncharacterized protein ARMOST_19491 [Armillaria ostoyae]|uniref:Uncharacterized protein n=1 Tax=Armillaria ostoyae TaxID=47428 RepID=A0A284S4Q5_ARMOS|nr:uncharacterized protein ARMOST_19491 [Armillaria ostoyae]
MEKKNDDYRCSDWEFCSRETVGTSAPATLYSPADIQSSRQCYQAQRIRRHFSRASRHTHTPRKKMIRALGVARSGGADNIARCQDAWVASSLGLKLKESTYAYRFGTTMSLQLRATPDGITVFMTQNRNPNIIVVLSCNYCTEYERMSTISRETLGNISTLSSFIF